MEEALIRVNAKEDRDAMMAKFFNRLNWDIDWYNYFEEKKVKLAVIEFNNYAIIWGGGGQLLTKRRRNHEWPVEKWFELKALMRRRFVPIHYYIDRPLSKITKR